ncbi:MAG: hypothetical protein K2X47_09520 [Bdellovibrionales bacterium]|nr:hypothetical protein [Bdellovibrionales bacterium]
MKLVKVLVLVLASSYSVNSSAGQMFGDVIASWNNRGSSGATVVGVSGDGWTSQRSLAITVSGRWYTKVLDVVDVFYNNGVQERYDQLTGVQTNYVNGQLCYDPTTGLSNCAELIAPAPTRSAEYENECYECNN